MKKSINLKTEEFKQALYNLINTSELPIVNIYMVFDKVFQELNFTYEKALSEEQAAVKMQERNENDEQSNNICQN